MARLFASPSDTAARSIFTAVLVAANARKVRDLTRTVRAVFPLRGSALGGQPRLCGVDPLRAGAALLAARQ